MASDYSEYTALIKGPNGTPWAGATFELSIEVGEDYPFKAPKIKFITPIFHPNVGLESGTVCVEELLDHKWEPHLTIAWLLKAVEGLMRRPKGTDYYLVELDDTEIMRLYQKKRPRFNEMARACVREFAIYTDLCALKIHLHREDIENSSFRKVNRGIYMEIHKYLNA